MYLFPLSPPPNPVDYATHLIPTASSPITPVHLSKATQQREAVRTLLQRNHDASSSTSSSSAGSTATIEAKLVSALEEYLPSLAAIFDATKTDDLVVRGPATFRWAPLLDPTTPSFSSSSPSFSSLSTEVENIVLLYALALHNLSILHTLSAGPTYDFSPTLPDGDRKARDAIVKRGAASWGTKAIHVARWLCTHADDVVRGWNGGGVDGQGARPARGSVDGQGAREGDDDDEDEDVGAAALTRRRRLWHGFATLLELAPTLAMLRVLTSAANSHAASTGTRPPPLPPGHASPGLLAKLFLEVPRIADEAKAEFEAAMRVLPSSSGGRKGEDGISGRLKRLGLGRNGSGAAASIASSSSSSSSLRVSQRLMRYLTAIAAWGRCTSLMYLGLQAGEDTRHAEAAVWLRMARDELVTRSAGEEQPDDDSDSDSSSDEGGRGGSSKETKAYAAAWDEMTGQRRFLKKQVRPMLRREMRRSKKDKEKRVGGLKGRFSSKEKAKSNTASLDTADGSVSTGAALSSSVHQHPLSHRLVQYHSTLLTSGTTPLLAHLYKTYRNLNDTISFQPSPARADLLAKMPGPRPVLSIGDAGAQEDGWQMPRAEWGTRVIPRRGGGEEGQELEIGVGLIGGTGGSGGGNEEQKYAGQGAYY
ncbi:hypothetical protein BDZ90DRAFT_279451 [Jaminaea rosea]|uniref:PH-response regulator protein palC n=1 Tax=Jaminaea rosea TaxID=1569628 RepID=A0A316UQV0_9BASI|nr:hypothetical protein BDZ90DRAFT_279451 [Jaminaea rosea]PWN27670.1 hypothetical protein BDZ90DRAFT_279451 [Jaminaea rosea]